MNAGIPNSAQSQIYSLVEYIGQSSLTMELFERIGINLKEQSILSSMLISVKDNSVIQPFVSSESHILGPGDKVCVWDYTIWREAEAALLSNGYDLRRFNRTMVLETLCRKVKEHQQYSFIARIKTGGDSDQVIKYSFVRMDDDAQMILCLRQEITKCLEHDILTGGLNREGLLRELTVKFKNCPPDTKYAVVCFNIKNFRVINEMHGSKIGDKVLQHMYTSMVYSELHPVSYARFESDNFICLVRHENLDMDVVTRLCLQECLIDNLKVTYRCLCGIYHVQDLTVSSFEACAHAKLATNYIKEQFITPWIVFDPKMQQTTISDSEVLEQLDEAIAQNEFVPYYQPVVNIQTGRVDMAEALVRWKSSKHGMMSPALFVPVLERHGGLSRIDQIMEERVFRLQQQRLLAGRPTVPIDLNLSWTDFADTNLINQLQEHILDPSVPTDLVRFEITETAYEEIAENRLDVLDFFQKNDVKLLVDDFGQGYSFGTMKNVDFHIIKLDKTMIDKLGQSRKMDLLVKTLIGVFHSLNSKVVAEGVENESQVEYLKQAGCDYIQGYYYYKPMDEEAFLQLIDQQHDGKSQSQTSADDEDTINTDATILVDREVLEEQNEKLKQKVEESKCLRMLLDEQDIHYFEWNIHTHDDVASDKFVKMYGLPSNIIRNMPEKCDLVLEEDRDRFRAFYDRAARGEKMGSDCFRLYKPDGDAYTWYRKTFYTLFDQNGMPYKAIITMQDCQDEYRYRMLRTRDRMLIVQQEIVTFIYTTNNDTISITFRSKDGEVMTASLPHFLSTPPEKLLPDQAIIAENIRRNIKEGVRSGYFDFHYPVNNTDYRAHFSMVDGEYGHLYAVIGQAEDINKTRERLNAKEELLRLAEIDSLTQIYNRTAGEHKMSELLKQHEAGVFGVLDCDKFKNVNDTFGHVVGDSLLSAIGKILKNGNPSGISMRLGGDEFAFFVYGNYTKESIEQDLMRLFHVIDQLQVPGMEDYRVSISVGVVIYDGKEDVDFDCLYRKADALLYQSKKFIGNKVSM